MRHDPAVACLGSGSAPAREGQPIVTFGRSGRLAIPHEGLVAFIARQADGCSICPKPCDDNNLRNQQEGTLVRITKVSIIQQDERQKMSKNSVTPRWPSESGWVICGPGARQNP